MLLGARRSQYRNCYKLWRPDDDRVLLMAYRAGYGVPELAKAFERMPSAIYRRLDHLVVSKHAINGPATSDHEGESTKHPDLVALNHPQIN